MNVYTKQNKQRAGTNPPLIIVLNTLGGLRAALKEQMKASQAKRQNQNTDTADDETNSAGLQRRQGKLLEDNVNFWGVGTTGNGDSGRGDLQ
jgi:hypothetical protein